MKTVAEIEITTEGILRNGSRMETTGTGSELLNNAYRAILLGDKADGDDIRLNAIYVF